MNTTTKIKIRHPAEAKMLMDALDGNNQAANEVLIYLSSTNPNLRQIMQITIHDLNDDRIWGNLLKCLAIQQWNNQLDCERRTDSDSSERIDNAIIEVLTGDKNEDEKGVKEAVLLKSLESSEPKIRQAAAVILGMRGDPIALSGLDEIIETGTKTWKLRAINALADLRDEHCGKILAKIFIAGGGELHREAGLALRSLGVLAESTWVVLLDHPDSHIRWHAARGLSETGDARTANVLAEGLLDENYAVRWATSDVLAHMGASGVQATLAILSRHRMNEPMRQAAFHALHGIASRKVQKRIKPLVDALRGSAASIEAPVIAQRLLMEWDKVE
ncbi:MAG: HEAT repeat domain-containing protein [Chloroflexota bacterium]